MRNLFDHTSMGKIPTKHETSVPRKQDGRKPPHMETDDSAERTSNRGQRIGSQIRRNREEIFYRFDRLGTLPRTIATAFETPERVVCEIVRDEYRGMIERVRRAS